MSTYTEALLERIRQLQDEIEAEINAAPASEDTEGGRPLYPPGCLMVSRTAEGV